MVNRRVWCRYSTDCHLGGRSGARESRETFARSSSQSRELGRLMQVERGTGRTRTKFEIDGTMFGRGSREIQGFRANIVPTKHRSEPELGQHGSGLPRRARNVTKRGRLGIQEGRTAADLIAKGERHRRLERQNDDAVTTGGTGERSRQLAADHRDGSARPTRRNADQRAELLDCKGYSPGLGAELLGRFLLWCTYYHLFGWRSSGKVGHRRNSLRQKTANK